MPDDLPLASFTGTYAGGFGVLLWNGSSSFMQLWCFFFYALELLAAFMHLPKSAILCFRIADLVSSVRDGYEENALQNHELCSERSVGVRRLLQALFQNAVCGPSQSQAVTTLEALYIMQATAGAF